MNSDNSEEAFEFLLHLIKKEATINKGKAAALAGQFSSLGSFKQTDFLTKKFQRMDGIELKFNGEQRQRIENLKKYIFENLEVRENWIRYLAANFVETQLENIGNLSLETMNMNPFLIRALKLSTPDEVIRFNVYQTATRSIVTSMGFTIEMMVGHSGARMGEKGEWYDVVKEIDSLTYWIQVKSGPNDVDKDQVKHFSLEFDKTESKKNNLARLGITYGKRNLNTISMNHIKSYLNKWKERLLVGRELWDFVSSEKNYHSRVLKWIDEVSASLLHGKSIEQEIESSIKKITSDFESKYGKGKAGVDKYVKESM